MHLYVIEFTKFSRHFILPYLARWSINQLGDAHSVQQIGSLRNHDGDAEENVD